MLNAPVCLPVNWALQLRAARLAEYLVWFSGAAQWEFRMPNGLGDTLFQSPDPSSRAGARP